MIVLAAVFAVAACLPFASTTTGRRDFYFFEVELTSKQNGQTQVFFDMGRGSNESDSSRQPLYAGQKPVNYRFMLPPGILHGLRFDPTDRENVMTLAHPRIVDHTGRVIRTFAASEIRAVQQISKREMAGEVAHIETEKLGGDPIMEIPLSAPIALPISWRQQLVVMRPVFLSVFFGTLMLMLALAPAGMRTRAERLIQWARARPKLALALIAGVAVVLQCHPVVFFGKSFVSPDNAGYLLYDTFPTLPGYRTEELEDAKGADVGAMLYQHLYYPISQREALFKHGELPLWNRYDLCGVPMLGQGQSMFGDALNLLPMAANSAAWAWDAKFVLARWLYALGIGLIVLRLTRHLASAGLLAFAAPFIGFFAFRINHPAQFSLCYAPWILFAWLLLRDAAGRKGLGLALALWIFANWEVMTSGTVKEAYMLIFCLNLAGLFALLGAEIPWRDRGRKLLGTSVAGVVFLLLSAPLWLTFFDALKSSHTSYDHPGAMQIQPSLLIGFFEDLFYRQLRPGEIHANPSANLVVLLGLVWALVQARTTFRQRGFVAIGAASLLPFAIVFGFIPAALIVKLPFISNIHHTDNTFSCSLIILWTVLAGFGLKALRDGLATPARWAIACLVSVAVIAALAWMYFAATKGAPKSAFFHGYLTALALGLAGGLGGLAYWARSRRPGILLATVAATLLLLLWRHGLYLRIPFDTYVFNPKVRADFRAPSPAVALVNTLVKEPSRPAGIGFNLFSGFHQMLGWEGIYGVDALRNGYFDELAMAGGARKVRWWDSPGWSEEDLTAQQPFQDMANVRYYLAGHSETPRERAGLQRLASLDLDVYESSSAWPRAFFADRVGTYASLPEFVSDLRRERTPFASLAAADRETAPLPAELPAGTSGRSIRPAYDYALTTNSTTFTVDAPGPGVIVLSESYYPRDFQVTLNDDPVPYFRVNHAFKGIGVPRAGHYYVRFTYRPHRLTLALWLGAGGLVLFVALGATCWRSEKSPTAAFTS